MKGKYFLVRICSDHCIMFWLQLKHFRKLYESYVPMKYRSYLKQMKKLDLCGDAYLFCSCKNAENSIMIPNMAKC